MDTLRDTPWIQQSYNLLELFGRAKVKLFDLIETNCCLRPFW